MNKHHPFFFIASSFLLGAISVLSFSPFNHYFISLLSLSALFYIWYQSNDKNQNFLSGLFFGLGLFGFGISWIYISLNKFGGMPPWLSVLSTFLFCIFFAFFIGAIGWFSSYRKSSFILTPFIWTFLEWIKGWFLTGFPWLTMGYSQIPSSPLAGFLPLIGVYGVTLILTCLAILLSYALTDKDKSSKFKKIGVITVVLISGHLLKDIQWTEPTGKPISVSLIQGNIAQDIKWQKETIKQILKKN